MSDFLKLLEGLPVYVVALYPSAVAVAQREAQRGKKGYVGFEVEGLHRLFMEETPRVGLWLDSSELSADETVDAILRRSEEARLVWP